MRPLAGQLVSDWKGYRGVMAAIALAVSLALLAGIALLRETRGEAARTVALPALARQMLGDARLRRAAVLVAGLNLLAFSFYSAGPFMTGPLPGLGFGWIGLAIPNLLGPALKHYGHCLGRAGALFGVAYYSLLGLGLAATSWLPFDAPQPLSLAWLAVVAVLLAAHRRQRGEQD